MGVMCSDSCTQIDGLDEYLNDPVKQHYLVRVLPAQIKRQLLYKRSILIWIHLYMYI